MPAHHRAAAIEIESARYSKGDRAWRLAFEFGASPMWIEDTATKRLVAANDAAIRRYGYSCEQFGVLTLEDLRSEPEPGRPGDEGSAALIRHRTADGSVIDLEIEKCPVDFEGRPCVMIVAIEPAALSLRESEQRYRQLFETAADGYWEMDAKGRFTSISPRFGEIFEASIADWLGKRLNDIPGVAVLPEMAARAFAAITARLPFRDFVHRLQGRPGGKTRWVHANFVPFFDCNGVFQGYRGVSRDISAQTDAEEALRKSEERARQLYEIASDYYFEADTTMRLTYVSPSHEKIFGIPDSVVIGHRFSPSEAALVSPEMIQKVRTAIIAKQPNRDFVFPRKLPNGTMIWVSVSAMPVFDEDGTLTGWRGVGADVTARVQAENAARRADRRLQNAVAYVHQPLAVYDDEDRMVAFNKAFDDLHGGLYHTAPLQDGVSFEAVSAWQVEQGFYGDDEVEQRIDLPILMARYQTELEHAYHLSNGKWMLVSYRALPEGGKVGLWTDVTAIKQAEGQRRGLEAQLQHSQRLESVGVLAGGVAHEINNALVPIIVLSKLVAKKLPEESRERHNLGTVVAAAERSRDLVAQILAFSRKDTGERPYTSIDLAAILSESLKMLRATIPAGIRIETEILSSAVMIGDASQLQQVIVNLVNNAVQAIGAQGSIWVSLRPEADGTSLCLSVADTGCGMDEATLKRIFEPFFTTKPVGVGTGLGLSVAHGIIEHHGGRIAASSEIGCGTRFDLYLPVSRPV